MSKTPVESPVIFLAETDSTNNEAARHLHEASHGTVWVAAFQHAGRGQQDNRWESEAGKNLLFSVLFRPVRFRAENQFLLSQAVSLGVCMYLRDEGLPALIKWPNDIYVGEKKIAGLLLEHHVCGEYISATIAGVGLNVNQQHFGQAPQAVSMRSVMKKEYHLRTVLEGVLAAIFRYYESKPGLRPAQYLNALYRYRRWAWYQAGGNCFRAQIVAVKPAGDLLLEHEDGAVHSYLQKSIVFLPHDFIPEN
ncbi:MAG: biotin--[acetyl-CoA-carboxylase] ligase [Prevotellaceae bacterium]|jgi:BirA family biotin operon repressor/biotin-[acetyl-CoA-carboxylase] ligase|nr:biotin--[acetyl-CoA-carboxylase] ligase [Prevotellaceae bacterium]